MVGHIPLENGILVRIQVPQLLTKYPEYTILIINQISEKLHLELISIINIKGENEMKYKRLINLKPKARFTIPFDDKRKVLVKYTEHRITARKREGKCQISKLDGNLRVMDES